jgi:hypothetical protein
MTRIAVVGPGAMGCLFSGLLALAGHDVGLVCRDRDLAGQLAADGVNVERGDEVRRAAIWTYLSGRGRRVAGFGRASAACALDPSVGRMRRPPSSPWRPGTTKTAPQHIRGQPK